VSAACAAVACAAVACAAVALACASCTDPVRDRAIEALGDEDPAVPVGPDHRAGQPCLLCHSPGGPASGDPFAVAGTIYATNAPGAPGAPGVVVRFVDAANGSPRDDAVTTASGNFFVSAGDWDKITFPLRVAIFPPGAPAQPMSTTIDREGSCNFCHRPAPEAPLSPEDAEEQRRSIGPIFVRASAPAGGAP
jgi:hypothetical protein